MARASLLGVLSWHLGTLLCVFCFIVCFLPSQTVREAVQVSATKQRGMQPASHCGTSCPPTFPCDTALKQLR